MNSLFEHDQDSSEPSLELLIEAVRGLDSAEVSDRSLIDRVHELELVIAACGAMQMRLGHRLHDRRLAAGRARLAAGRVALEAARAKAHARRCDDTSPPIDSSATAETAPDTPEAEAAAFTDSVTEEALGRVTASTAREFGLARQESTATGRALLVVADTVCSELPLTLAALEAGATNAYRVRLVADAARKLPEELRAEFDRIVAPQLAGSTNLQVERKAKAAVYVLDPQGSLARLRRSIVERGVSSRPVGDGLVRLSITAPLIGAVAAFAALRKAAEAKRLSGDPRTIAQIMADEGVSRLTAGAILGCDHDGLPLGSAVPVRMSADCPTEPFDPVAEVNRRFREQQDRKGRADSSTSADSAEDSKIAGTAEESNVSDSAEDSKITGSAEDSKVGDSAEDSKVGDSAEESGVAGDRWDRWADQWVRDHPELADYPDDTVLEPPTDEPDDPWDESLLDDDTLFHWLDRWNARFAGLDDNPANDSVAVPDNLASSGDLAANSEVGLELKVHLHLIMTDSTLLFGGNEPGTLIGHGPLSADLARKLAALSESAGHGAVTTTIRRYLTDPISGRLADCDPTAREFPQVLKEFLTTRDQECRTPWCGAPIRHFDHIKPWATGGPTTKGNGQGLCMACNQIKESPGWTTTVDQASGTITTRTPTGHLYRSPEPRPHGSLGPIS